MMSFTPNQWAVVALVLVLGWLLGLLSRRSARPLRRALADERARREAAERDLATARGRLADHERAVGAAGTARRDNLSLIRGIDRERELRLNEAGVHGFADLEGLSDTDAAALESRLGLAHGVVAGEQWREQAATLRSEGVDAHRRRWLA